MIANSDSKLPRTKRICNGVCMITCGERRVRDRDGGITRLERTFGTYTGSGLSCLLGDAMKWKPHVVAIELAGRVILRGTVLLTMTKQAILRAVR